MADITFGRAERSLLTRLIDINREFKNEICDLVGFINEARTFEDVWKSFKPRETVPEIDFKVSLALFARNTQFYNGIRIGKVNVKNGVAEVVAMETMSAMPIEDKVGMSLVVVSRKGINSIRTPDRPDVISSQDVPRACAYE